MVFCRTISYLVKTQTNEEVSGFAAHSNHLESQWRHYTRTNANATATTILDTFFSNEKLPVVSSPPQKRCLGEVQSVARDC